MNLKDFNRITQEIIEKEIKLRKEKTDDYGVDSNPFHTIEDMAKNFGVSTPRVIGMLLHKHISSIYKAIRTNDMDPQCMAEPIEQRLMDARAFLMLLMIYLRDRQEIEDARDNADDLLKDPVPEWTQVETERYMSFPPSPAASISWSATKKGVF